MNKKQKSLTRVVLVLDGSASMKPLVSSVVKIANKYIADNANIAAGVREPTKLFVYSFSESLKCLLYDVDISSNPTIDESFYIGANTALIDASLEVISDLEKTQPQAKFVNCSNLVYIITDGENNRGHERAGELEKKLKCLPEEYTVAICVPNLSAKNYAQRFGFPVGNIQIFDAQTEHGFERNFDSMTTATQSYYLGKSRGIKGTKTLFQPNVANLTKTAINKKLDELNPNDYMILPVHQKKRIDDFVKSWNNNVYRVGSSYFQLTKPEKVQNYKQIAVREKSTSKVFSGPDARTLLGLPDYEVTVDAASHPKYDIFIQSTSCNRNLVPGTQLLVIK